MNDLMNKIYVADLVLLTGIYVTRKIVKKVAVYKAKKALKKELENLEREAEKGIVDVEDYIVYPA